MSSNTDTKLDPTAQHEASFEPKLAEHETKLATNPKGDESAEQPNSYTDAASNVAATVTSTAANMKDSVFSMFGGGAKKEKKEVVEDDEAANEPSGSSKAKKDKNAEEDDEASCWNPIHLYELILMLAAD